MFKNMFDDYKFVWDISIFKDHYSANKKLLAATELGIWEVFDNEVKLLSNIDSIAFNSKVIYQSKISPERLYVGHMNGLGIMTYKDG